METIGCDVESDGTKESDLMDYYLHQYGLTPPLSSPDEGVSGGSEENKNLGAECQRDSTSQEVHPYTPGFYKEIDYLAQEEEAKAAKLNWVDEWDVSSRQEYDKEKIEFIRDMQEKMAKNAKLEIGIYFCRDGFQHGEQINNSKGTIQYIKIPRRAKGRIGENSIETQRKWILSNVRKSKYTIEQIKDLKYSGSQTFALKFFFDNVILGTTFHHLQQSFETLARKLTEYYRQSPIPPVYVMADAITEKLISTAKENFVTERYSKNPSGLEVRLEPCLAESHRKLMITVERMKKIPMYEDLPNSIYNRLQRVYCDMSNTLSVQVLESLGRFFGNLLDKFFPCSAAMNLAYNIMTQNPSFARHFIYGMICANPDPFTMSPHEFDYCAVSLRDRTIFYLLIHTVGKIRSHLLNNLNHPKKLLETTWEEFGNYLISELSDFNFDYRREEAAKGFRLFLLLLKPSIFCHFCEKSWDSLMKDYVSGAYKMNRLLCSYISIIADVCHLLLQNPRKYGYNATEFYIYSKHIEKMQSTIGKFLESDWTIVNELSEIQKATDVKQRNSRKAKDRNYRHRRNNGISLRRNRKKKPEQPSICNDLDAIFGVFEDNEMH